MEGLESFHAYVKNLHHQAGVLAEAAVSLSKSFEAEADRLTREDGAQRLEAIHDVIAEELDRSRQLEDAASYGYTKANLTLTYRTRCKSHCGGNNKEPAGAELRKSGF